MSKALLLMLFLTVFAYAKTASTAGLQPNLKKTSNPNVIAAASTKYLMQSLATGFYPINGVCGKCKNDYFYDELQERCIGISP
jgi:hypothetical protein